MTKKQSVAVGNCASIHGSRRRTRRRRRITSAACFSLLGVVPASVLRAATDTWIGVSSSWDNTGNWSGGAAPNPTTYTTAVFGAYSSQSQPFVTQPETFSILQFSAGGWDISGTGTLDLSSITSTGSNTVAVTIVPRTGSIALTENAGTLTINSPVLPGTGSLSIAGSGTIVLNASSTAAGTIAFTTPVATTLVAGSQTAFGNDTLAFSTGSFNPNLVNASSGTIQIAAFSMPSVTSGTINFNSSTGNGFNVGGTVTLPSSSTLTLVPDTATLSLGSITASTSAILDLDGTTAGNTITGSITNGISLNKTNTSTWTLAGSSNNYYGATTVQAGTLVFATPGTFGPGNETLYYGMPVGSISVGGNATLSIQVNGEPDATTQTLSYNAGTLALGTGTLTNLDIGPLSGGTGTNKTIQLPTLSAAGSATLNITSANNYGLSFGSWTNASGTLNIAGTSGITFGLGVASLSSGGSLTLASTTANFSIGSVSTSTSAILDLDGTTAGNTITGSITNGISLNKTNTSTWTLAGSSNNYYGATTVQAGTLVFATPGTFGPGNETLYYGMPVGSISVGGNATLSIQVNGEPDATTQTLSYNAGTLALGTGTLTNLDIGPLSGGTGTNKTIQLPTLSAAGSATLNITSANNYGLSFGSWTNASGTLNIAGTSGITFGLGVASLSSGGSLTLASTTANFSIGSVSTSTSAILDLDGTTAGNTITGSITNGISLNKTNTSTWTLAGSSNNYYGATTVQAGTLVFATPGTFGPGNETLYYGMPVGSISVGGNATLSIQVNGEPDATTQTLSYNAGTLALGTGTLTNLDIGPLSGGTGTNKTIQLPTLSAAGSATLNITSANNYGLSFGSWTNASGTLNIAGTSGITFGLGVASLSSGGSLTLASNTANFSIGSITASGSATLDLDGTTTGNTITGSITNGIYLNKTNTSTWTLAGATNNYYGGTNISGGTLIIAGGLSVGSITQVGGTFVDAGTLAIASGGGNATGYTLNGGTLSAGTILVSNGGFNFNNGTVNLTNSNLAVTSGGLFGNSITLGSNKAINVSGTTTITGGTVNLGGGQLASGSIVVGTGGSLNWTSGTVSLTNSDLSVTAGSLLGATISLTSQNQEALNVSGTTNIASDGAVIVNGGTFTTGSINIASGGTFEYVTGAVSVANNPTFIATLIANNNGVVASGQSFGTTASFTPQTPTTTVVGSLAVGALNIPASNSVVDQGTVTAASLTGSGAFQLGQQATLNLTSTTVPLTVAMGQPVGSNFSVPTSSTVSSPGGITVGTTSGTSATFSSTGTVNTTMLTLQPNAMANFSGGTGYANTIVQSSGGSGALNFSGPVAFTNGGGAVVTNLFINNGASFSVLDQLPPFGEDPELNRALVAGYLSNGIITLGASGVLSSPYLKLGISSGETGTFTQTAGSASLSILCAGCDGTLTTGQGTGIANISGGTLYANTVLLGSTAGGSGAMTVSGSANVTVAGSAHINDLTVNGGSFTVLNQNSPITEDPELYRCIIGGYLTSGALNVGSTGFVSAPYIKLGITSGKTGTFNQTGGTVDVGTLTLGSDTVQSSGSGIGQATISGGTLSVGTLLIGSTAGGVGTLAISASANVTASVVSNGGAIAFSGGTSIIGQGNGTGTGAGGASTTGGFTGTGTLNVTGGSLTAATIRQATLNVGNGASVAIADSTLPAAVGLSVSSNTAATSVLTDLLFNGANFTTSATGSVDLKNNDMIINDASQHAYLISAIAHAYDNGNWDMSGITSSSAAANHTVYGLGYATGAELGTTSFDGQPITSGSTVVKYTLLGDTTLKGAVTGGDYSTVVANFGKTGQDWSQGNFFNVTSGPSVTGSDYSTVVANFGKTASGNVVSAMASPALTRAVTPDVQQGSVNDMHLEVNTSTGDVQLLAETTMTLSLYAVYDSSSNLRTGQWHKLSTGTATASTGVTYTPANWAVAGNSSGALGEGQNQGAYNSTIPSTFDNISLAAGQTIDLGNIFKTTTNSHTLSFEFQEPNASTGDPVNGYQDFLNGTTIDYIGGSTPEPSTLGILALGGVMMLVRRRRTPAKVTAIAWNKIKGDE